MKDKKYIIELGHANYEDEDLAVDGRRVFEHLSDKVPSIYDVRIGRGAPLNQVTIACADRRMGMEKYQILYT